MPVFSVNEGLLAAKGDCFVDFHLWPPPVEFDPTAWLQNFTDFEQEYALSLLNAFCYYPKRLIDALFVSGFQQLSTDVVPFGEPYLSAQSIWRQFVDSVVIVHVEGERPNSTDSGYAYARRARQLLDIPEERILSPAVALSILATGESLPVVFVDDFVGSGSQMTTTWHRVVPTGDGSGGGYSFEMIATAGVGSYYYCPLFCTEIGLGAVQLDCPAVQLRPVHLLPSHYNLLSSDCHLWPDHLRPGAEAFVREASRRAGIPESGTTGWQGFHNLGLALAWETSVPDATLPILYWEENGWQPLIRRR